MVFVTQIIDIRFEVTSRSHSARAAMDQLLPESEWRSSDLEYPRIEIGLQHTPVLWLCIHPCLAEITLVHFFALSSGNVLHKDRPTQ